MRYWIGLFLFGFVVFILLANTNYPTSPHYRILIGYAFTLSRYFLGEILVATGLLLAVVLYNRWRRQVTWVWLDIVCVALMLIALLDLRVSQVMSTRLDWDLLALAWGEGPKMMWQMAKPYLPMVMGAIGLISLVYFGTVRFLDRSASLQRSESAVLNMRFGLVLALLLSLVGRYVVGVDKATGPAIEVLARSSPLFRGVTDSSFPESEFRETAVRLGVIPSASTASSDSKNAPAPRDWNVVFVLLESTSNEHLSLFSGTRETQPLLSQYVNRMELFPNFFSSFAGSINARFACFAGLYPVRGFEQFTRRRVAVPSLFETLSDHGWATSVFYSSHFDYTNFRDFLRARKIDEMYDADTMPGERTTQPVSWGLREEETLAAMQHQIRKYAAAQKKFFLTYIPAAPHYPYDGVPERFRKFRSTEYRNFTAQYLNELLYMDWVITSLIDELKSNHLLDRTMIVITGDHGEMLGGEGSAVGHGWAITPQLANVPLIIMDPTIKSRTVNPTIGSQVDLLPTILSRLNLPVPFGQLYQGLSLDSLEAKQDRTIYLNSFSQFGVLRGHQMVCGERGNDRLKHFYEITNDGSRTQFASSPEVLFPMPSIAEFDRFQENFLRNYAGYAREHAEKVGRLAMRDESGSP